MPTIEKLKLVLIKARDEAIMDCKSLGMNFVQWENALTNVSIPKLDSADHEENNPTNATSEASYFEDQPHVLEVNEEDAEDINQDQIIFKDLENLNDDGNNITINMALQKTGDEPDILELSEEDAQDVDQDQNTLKGLKSLNVRDFSGNKLESDSSILKIKINKKVMLVKKSTLCWLFYKKKGRLSSDRLLRCKSMGGSGVKAKAKDSAKDTKRFIKRTAKKRANIQAKKISESETSLSDTCTVHSEFEFESVFESEDESLGDNYHHNNQSLHNIKINQEDYYAVCYQSWYIGRSKFLILKAVK